jgi:hypothetical protein
MLMAFFMFAKWWKFTTNFYSLGKNFFHLEFLFQNFDNSFVVYIFPWIFTIFSIFPKNNLQIRKIQN